MKLIRILHLYLGCVFAPMLLFFALTGIYQTLFPGRHDGIAGHLFGLHTSRGMKDGSEWTGPATRWFVVAMAASFILSTALGVMMAFQYSKRRLAVVACLLAGILVPAGFVLLRIYR